MNLKTRTMKKFTMKKKMYLCGRCLGDKFSTEKKTTSCKLGALIKKALLQQMILTNNCKSNYFFF